MKKKGWIITIAIVSLVVGSGSAIAANVFSVDINKQKAKEIALKEVPGTITDIDLEREHGNVVYEVDITKENSFEEVEVQIHANTGKVLSTKHDDDDRKVPIIDSTPSSVQPSEAVANTANATKNSITAEQAGKLALTVVQGEVLRVEQEWDDGIQEYEVKVRTNDGIVKVDIAAADGRILEVDYDDDHDDNDDDYEDD